MLRITPLDESEASSSHLQALLALKKGTSLIKYCRKGKPKLCPFRLSTDETTLIWYSHKTERNLKLDSVSQINPGQRTAVFRRFFCPEKDYLSFSLIYKNGDRSLDLICKDKDEFEIWFGGLKALVTTGQKKNQNLKNDGSQDTLSFDSCSIQSSPLSATLDIASTISQISDATLNVARKSDVGPDRAAIMQIIRQSNADTFRTSVSSAPSYFSQGSGPDDCESLGDVFIWGELWCDSATDTASNTIISRTDVLLPKPLESNVVLDVHQISCGVKHASLVTRQGEVFTWGEESGGRLGLGTNINASNPQLVELLSVNHVESVACGEYHTCVVSVGGDLFTWGDGTNNIGLLGHGSDVSHWIPKRVTGPLEGIQVHSIACGTWHSALVTTTGRLFTFGDGSFGVLGHGDRESSLYPREVEALSKSRTLKVACGAWHTAAIIEVSGQVATSTNSVSKKLFTWGDGDKYRLGHGDKNPRLVPICVSPLIDYNFHELACGDTITIGLTTSGRVFTMGSTAYGQLGNPHSDGKLPCVVHERLANELVEDIACGSYHVAVLTSRSEVYTWGNGGNGRLGQGDIEDRKTPTLIEALKDRHVKSISCGSNFTACVCIHKWVSGADQSVCSGCRQAFGFTKKRHNCYNCGLVSCHSCSSKKVLRAALAPTPGKPHRVCDSCYSKIKAAETVTGSTFIRKKVVVPSPRERLNVRKSRSLFSSSVQPVKYIMIKPARHGRRKSETLLQLREISFPNSKPQLNNNDNALDLEPIVSSQTPVTPPMNSRSVSPYKLSPSPCITPMSSRTTIESLKKTNEHLNQEILNLQEQVRNLKQKYDFHDDNRHKYGNKSKESTSSSPKESSNADQMKYISERFPLDANNGLIIMQTQADSSLSELQELSNDISSDTNEDAHHARNHSNENISFLSKLKSSNEKEGNEIIEQFEFGVYITFIRLQDGTKAFKRIRFSKRRFAAQQAEEWWKNNQERVFKKYGQPISEKSLLIS